MKFQNHIGKTKHHERLKFLFQGDEGDPLVQNGKAVGLFINSVDCTRDEVPVIFCDLRKLRKWIALIIRHHTAAGLE